VRTDEPLILTTDQIFVLSTVLASIDLLSITPQLPEHDYPDLSQVVVNQGLFCDAITVILLIVAEKNWAENLEQTEEGEA
jgi:hypothetical protein